MLARLYRDYRELNARLDEWFCTLQASVAGPLYHPNLAQLRSKHDDEAQGRIFPIAFSFPSFVIGYTMVFFWIANLITKHQLCLLHGRLSAVEHSPRTVNGYVPTCPFAAGESGALPRDKRPCPCQMDIEPLDVQAMDWTQHARNICQSVEYFLQDNMGDTGPASIFPALTFAKLYFGLRPRSCKREIFWVGEMLEHVSDKGVAIAGSVGNLISKSSVPGQAM